MNDHDRENLALRDRSDGGASRCGVVSLIYSLVIDHLPLGVVERLVREAAPTVDATRYTNGHVRRYAEDAAARLLDKPVPTVYSEASPPEPTGNARVDTVCRCDFCKTQTIHSIYVQPSGHWDNASARRCLSCGWWQPGLGSRYYPPGRETWREELFHPPREAHERPTSS